MSCVTVTQAFKKPGTKIQTFYSILPPFYNISSIHMPLFIWRTVWRHLDFSLQFSAGCKLHYNGSSVNLYTDVAWETKSRSFNLHHLRPHFLPIHHSENNSSSQSRTDSTVCGRAAYYIKHSVLPPRSWRYGSVSFHGIQIPQAIISESLALWFWKTANNWSSVDYLSIHIKSLINRK